MKRLRFLRLPVLMLLLLALCACAPSGSEPAPAATPAPEASQAPASTEPPIPDWLSDEPVPDFLDPEQQDLYCRARAAASFLMGCDTIRVDLDFPLSDGTTPEIAAWETVTLDNGQTYLLSAGRYQRWEDFQAMLDGLFTPEYQEELLWTENLDGEGFPLFTSTPDGRMCFIDASRGSDLEYDWCDTPDSFELVSQTEDELVFDLVGHYADLTAEPDAQGRRPEYTQRYPIRMERTGEGWRLAEFHIPY